MLAYLRLLDKIFTTFSVPSDDLVAADEDGFLFHELSLIIVVVVVVLAVVGLDLIPLEFLEELFKSNIFLKFIF